MPPRWAGGIALVRFYSRKENSFLILGTALPGTGLLDGDRQRCLEAGMDSYLSKPIRAAALYEAVEKTDDREPQPPATKAMA